MRRKFAEISKKAGGFAVVLSTLVSCLNDPGDEVRRADQLFRPVSFAATVDGGTAEFSWVPIRNASYSLEISRDSLKFEREVQVIPLDGITHHVVENLWSQSRYSARIKAVSKEPGIKDSEYQVITFLTGTENIFFGPDAAAIFSDRVLLSWDQSRAVSHIRVLRGEEELAVLTLSDAETAAGSRLVEGLKADTEYTFQIYRDNMLRGTISVTTRPGN